LTTYFPKAEETYTYTLFIVPNSRSSPALYWFPRKEDEKKKGKKKITTDK